MISEADFDYLRRMLHSRSGLSLGPDKRYLADSRLAILCRRKGIEHLDQLMRQLRHGNDAALEKAVVEAMTTNETLFFRDTTPFDLFRDVIMPAKLDANAATRTLRIWCAAVSSGQEAYSLAMILDDMADRLAGWHVEILGTDISSDVVEKARAGLYSQFEIQRGLPIRMLLKHFRKDGDRWRISDRLRAMVDIRQHNLLDAADHLGPFDVIFCRNVLIYFDIPTKTRVLSSIARRLAPDGVLLLGATETVIGLPTSLISDGTYRSLYRNSQRLSPPPAANSTAPLPAALAKTAI